MDYIDILLQAIEKSGVTPYKISKGTGISNSTLSSWKQNKTMPSMDKAIDILRYLGISADELFDIKPTNNLTEFEKEVLKLTKNVPVKRQERFLGRLEGLAKEYPAEDEKRQETANSEERSFTSRTG